jgi:hypothetical protein
MISTPTKADYEQTVTQMMSARGQACARLGQKSVEKTRAWLKQYPDLEAFLDA